MADDTNFFGTCGSPKVFNFNTFGASEVPLKQVSAPFARGER